MLLSNIRKINDEDQRSKSTSRKTIQFLLGSTVVVAGAMLLRYPRQALSRIANITGVGSKASDVMHRTGAYTSSIGAFISHYSESIHKAHIIERSLHGGLSKTNSVGNAFDRALAHAKMIHSTIMRGDEGMEPLEVIESFRRTKQWQESFRQARNILPTDPLSEDILKHVDAGLYKHHKPNFRPRADIDPTRNVSIADLLLSERDRQSGKGFDKLLDSIGLGESSTFIKRILDEHQKITARGATTYYKNLHGLSDEFIRGISELGGFSDRADVNAMSFIGKAIRAVESGTATEAQHLSGKRFFELSIDNLTRIDNSVGRNLIDMRRAARSIETTRGYLHKNFHLPILKFSPMDIIMPSAPQSKGFQIYHFGRSDIPTTITSRIQGQKLDRGLTLINDQLYKIGEANDRITKIDFGGKDFKVVQKGAARELLDSMSGRPRRGQRNFIDEVIQGAWGGSEAHNLWEGFKDVFDLKQKRPSVWTNIISYLTKGKPSTTNRYAPTVMRHLDSLSATDKRQFVKQIGDGDITFSGIYSYVESSIRGPINDPQMDDAVGSLLIDIAKGFKDPKSKIAHDIGAYGVKLKSGRTHISDVVKGGLGGKRSIMELLATDDAVDALNVFTKSRIAGGSSQPTDLRNIVGLFRKHGKHTLENMYSDSTRLATIHPMDNPQLMNIYDRSLMALQRTVVTDDFAKSAVGYTNDSMDRIVKMNVLNKLADINNTRGKHPLMDTLVQQTGIFNETNALIKDIYRKRGVWETGVDPGLDWSTAQWFDVEGVRSIDPDLNIDVIKEAIWNPFDFFIKHSGKDPAKLKNRPTDFTNRLNEYFQAAEEGFNIDSAKAYMRQFMPEQISEVTTGSIMPYRMASSLAHMLDRSGLGLGPRSFEKGPGGIISGLIYNRALPIALGISAYNYSDRELEGITGAGIDDRVSSTLAGSRIAVASTRDTLGMTSFTKWIYDTLPGSEYIGKDLLGTIPGVGDYGLNLGLDESAEDLQEFYSEGYVPVRSGRWWLASKTPWGGGPIAGWRPNWAVREEYNIDRTDEDIAAERKHSIIPSLLPSGPMGISTINAIIDPYWKEKMYYDERPYGMTGSLLNPTTISSGFINNTIGSLIKPRVRMHENEIRNVEYFLSREYPRIHTEDATAMTIDESEAGGSYDVQSGGITSGGSGSAGELSRYTISALNRSAMTSYPGGGGPQIRDINYVGPYHRTIGNDSIASYAGKDIITTNNLGYQLGMSEYQMTEMAGLRGFAFANIAGYWGTSKPVIEEFGVGNIEDIWWGENLGSGPMPFESLQETTELLRRFWPHQRSEVNYFNPVRNTQGDWVPSGATYFTDFQHGDPYEKSKVPGEGSVAGIGFENLWGEILGDDFYLKPRASMLGYNFEKQVGMLAGYGGGNDYAMERGDIIHEQIQQNIAEAGYLVDSERVVNDLETGITGHIDIIANFGKGEQVVEVKTLSEQRMEDLPTGGYPEHIGQINFYLKTQGADSGYIYYINRSDPNDTQIVPIQYNEQMLNNDIERAYSAQREVARRIDMGVISPYQPYGSAARTMSLAVTAPWSDEYIEEKELALEQYADNPQIMARLEKFDKMASLTKTRKQFTPYKYLGGKGSGGFIGEIWEGFAHMDTPMHTKFLPVRSAQEDYERSYLYGDQFGNWDDPIANWVEPTMRGVASKNPAYATTYGAGIGWMFGRNRSGALAGATAGAFIGGGMSSMRALLEMVSGDQWIPGKIRKQRNIEEYFEMLKYIKWQGISNITGHPLAEERVRATNIGMDPMARDAIRAVPKVERAYIDAFAEETNEDNQESILEMVSEPARRILEARYGMDVEAPSQNPWEYFQHHYLPPSTWEGWSPGADIDDYKVSYLDHQGMDLHDFNMWPEDVAGALAVGAVFPHNINRPRRTLSSVRKITESTLHELGVSKSDISISHSAEGSYNTRITVRKDVTREAAQRATSGQIRYG